MPRLMGIDIPDNKRIEISLRYIHGIGPARAARVLEIAKIDRRRTRSARSSTRSSRKASTRRATSGARSRRTSAA